MQSLRALIVDDNRGLAETVADILSDHGYEARVVSSGVQALVAWRTGPADLVVLDVDLPDIQGVTLARRLARRAAASLLVVMSASDPKALMPLCEELGAAFLAKPFSPSHLLAAVQRIGQRRASQHKSAKEGQSGERRLLGPRKPRGLLQHSHPGRRTH